MAYKYPSTKLDPMIRSYKTHFRKESSFFSMFSKESTPM